MMAKDVEGSTVSMHRISLSKIIGLSLVAVTLTLLGWSYLHWRATHAIVPSQSYPFDTASLSTWTAIGGSWQTRDGILYNNSYERGAKLLTGSTAWRNYTVNVDLAFTSANADMGLVMRADNEKEGTDSYSGYYIGIRTLDGGMVVGRSEFAWREAHPVNVRGGVHPLVWYHMRATAYGCNIGATVQNLTTLQTTWIAFEDSSCLHSGRVGVRALNPGAMWRNFTIAPASKSDYLDIRQHAGIVEDPEVVPGPPWWTPWHAAILCAGTLLVALLTQLAYFRMQQWKIATITRERERLAHDIHDTMAQSFAGIGYQIQGIRTSLMRGDRVDSSEISSQLSVAYQLVRKCHEEASRTIAMLASNAAPLQQNLLSALETMARKIAGNQIQTIVELRGNPQPLNLRLVDALLHIGGEAIVNAVGHADPTLLRITLSFFSGNVDLCVTDNGHGFVYSPETAGFGILGMQKRARDLGGTLEIVSSPESGTSVRITTPLQQQQRWVRSLAQIGYWLRDNKTGFQTR
jgi:signal transduction histidine kinase